VYGASKRTATTAHTLTAPLNMAAKLVIRVAQLSIYSMPMVLLWSTMMVLGDSGNTGYRERGYEAILTFLKRSGGAFIKVGQWAATRPDIFPDRLCQRLAVLQGNAPSHSTQHTIDAVNKYELLRDSNIRVGRVIGSGTVGQSVAPKH
jgi:predicted unusual protein kinase regulating ubiquinone biosynthesis (AarF/ABC1/UbiB family)